MYVLVIFHYKNYWLWIYFELCQEKANNLEITIIGLDNTLIIDYWLHGEGYQWCTVTYSKVIMLATFFLKSKLDGVCRGCWFPEGSWRISDVMELKVLYLVLLSSTQSISNHSFLHKCNEDINLIHFDTIIDSGEKLVPYIVYFLSTFRFQTMEMRVHVLLSQMDKKLFSVISIVGSDGCLEILKMCAEI